MTVAVHALHAGGVGQRSILFCHATGFHARVWKQVSHHLRAPIARYALDFHGHGHSSPLSSDATWDAFSDDVTDAVNQLGERSLVGVGHSLGGTALLLAEAELPGMFERIVCYEPILATDDDPGFAAAASRRRDRFTDIDEARRRFADRGPFARFDDAVLQDYIDGALKPDPGGGVRLRCPPSTEAQIYASARTSNWQHLIPRVSCPVEFLVGSESTVVDRDSLRSVAAAMSRARVVVLPGVGHLGPLEQPATFAACVAELL